MTNERQLFGSVSMRMAALVQFGSKYANIAIQLAITAVLSRILTPDDYGVVAITQVFAAFFTMLADTGISTAVVQYRDLTDEDLGALMSFTLLLGAALTAMFCLAAWPISWAYGSDVRVLSQCWATSPAVLLACANMVPNGYLLRERRFPAIGARLLVASFVSGALGMVVAFAGLGPYSLALQVVTQAAVVLVWNLIAHPTPLRYLTGHFFGTLHCVFRYSAFQFGFNFINYFSRNLDNLLLGRYMGATALAFYDKAYKLTTYPMNAVSGVIGSVIQPYMAEHQDDPDRIFEGWMSVEKLISLVAAPACAMCICCSEEIVLFLFGDQWVQSVPLFHALAYSVYFQMMNNTSGAFFQSLGRTDLMLYCGIITTCMTAGGIVLGLVMGSTLWVAKLVSLAFVSHTAAVMLLLVKLGFRKPISTSLTFLPDLGIAAACVFTCVIFEKLVSTTWVVRLGMKCALLLTIFAAGYVLTNRIDMLKQALGFRNAK